MQESLPSSCELQVIIGGIVMDEEQPLRVSLVFAEESILALEYALTNYRG